MKLIIVSNRLPLKIIEENNEYKMVSSPGGLSTGLCSLEMDMPQCWVGWPGLHLEEGEEKEKFYRLLAEKQYCPVDLSPEQIENYYEGYSNDVLWPLCHYFLSWMHDEYRYWKAYKEVNSLFCDAVMEIIEPDDIVWIHDYHLMLLPQLIREKMPEISIGYFLHIPFPSYELFRILPERAALLNGLLGADLLGFHIYGYARHFISAAFNVLKLDTVLDEIYLDDRVVYANAFPMGIHYEKYYQAMQKPSMKKKAQDLKKNFGKGKLILSVDRLDYSKGILIRLKGFETFLESNPQYKETISLVMIVSPSRDHVSTYIDLKNEIDKTVGNINGKYSTAGWRPVYYFYRTFDFEELIPLFYISDIALVTPLRDGMNLVAKEYVAVKRNKPGILILSEMAGAAVELSDAIVVNPNAKEIANAIVQALKMPEKEQLAALHSMQQIIASQTVQQWAEDFIAELSNAKARNDALRKKIVGAANTALIAKQYHCAQKRLIILDYDGTLMPFFKDPKSACPTSKLLHLLATLSKDARNYIVVSSGRDQHTLELWLGYLPIGLSAEHGAFYKENGKWHQKVEKTEWDAEILNIMQRTVKRTPHSKLEIKETALVWHYRNVDTWLAELRVAQLVDALINPCARNNLQIMKGNKIVEIKPIGVSKGDEINRLMSNDHYDFVMAMGDDVTDEEMFCALPGDAITIKVGKNSNAAKYNIPAQRQTIAFLKELIKRK